ncbi:zinc finger protein 2 homolog [Stylophora pistillata]|uniref:zinc finger protein 2 homolog n=1 Tax=Stylophora pistillata TaxID=50429 RepID=UPI000C054133|nr:zinc finger protein 2 homolog [Stylophora pistillata]
MDTVNAEHLELLILSSNPESGIDKSSSESENVSTAVEVETVMIAEEAGILVPDDSTSLAETAEGSNSYEVNTAGNKQFKCVQCDKTFSGASSLSRHIKTHSNIKPFKCDECDKVFSRLSSLKRHQNSHAAEKPFKCQVCGSSFIQNSDLKIHERTHTGEKPFSCDRCEKAFGCKKRLRAHYRMHTGEKPYKCPQCEKSFSMRKNVIQHIRIHTGERPYTCEVCKKNFRHQHTLKKHLQLHTVRPNFTKLSDEGGDGQSDVAWPRKKKGTKSVPKNPSVFRTEELKKVVKKSDGVPAVNSDKGEKSEASDAIQDTQSVTNEVEQSTEAPDRNEEAHSSQKIQKFVVETLNSDHLLLLTLANSGVHVSSGTDEHPHSTACAEPVLGTTVEGNTVKANGREEVTNDEHLMTNLAGPSEELPEETFMNGDKFKCPQCNKCLSGPSSLSRHIRTHKNEKPFKCDQCDKVFSRLSSLKRHQNSHSEEKPFKCQVCGSSFIQNSDLKIHERTHTGEKPFPCDRCEKAFGCKKRLRAHYRMHTGEKPYKCPQCEKSFSMRKNVIQHIRIHTGERPYTCWVCKKNYRHQHTLKKHIRMHADKNKNLDNCIQKIKGQQLKGSVEKDNGSNERLRDEAVLSELSEQTAQVENGQSDDYDGMDIDKQCRENNPQEEADQRKQMENSEQCEQSQYSEKPAKTPKETELGKQQNGEQNEQKKSVELNS